MYQHDDPGSGTGGAVAWPAHLVRAEATIVRRRRLPTRTDLVVDLGEGIGSPRWYRGVATLGAMIVALAHVAPGLRPPPIAARQPDVVVADRPASRRGIPFPMRTTPMPPEPVSVAGPRPPDGPLHLRGVVGGGLYRGLIDAGAAPVVAADYLRAIATRIDVGAIAPADRFDLVVARDGSLLYAGIVHGGQPLSLLRWTLDGHAQWFDAAGVGAPGAGLTVPVADARLSSGFGMRFHPILGFGRMHQGVDLAAPAGTPIVSAAEGIVRFAGVHGGYGNFVQVQHDGGLGTGYGHMRDIVVRPGEIVRQGELLGYVGSTGLSTGPHCHFEVYRGGVAVDPTTAPFATTAQLQGDDLARFHALLARVAALPAR